MISEPNHNLNDWEIIDVVRIIVLVLATNIYTSTHIQDINVQQKKYNIVQVYKCYVSSMGKPRQFKVE